MCSWVCYHCSVAILFFGNWDMLLANALSFLAHQLRMILGSQNLLNILEPGSCEVICVFGAPAKVQVRNAANSLLVYCSINSITSLKWVTGESGRYSHAKTTHSAMLHIFLESSGPYHQGLKNKKTDPPTQELKKSSESRPHSISSFPFTFPMSLIEFLHLIYVFLVSSSFVFSFFPPLVQLPLQVHHLWLCLHADLPSYI